MAYGYGYGFAGYAHRAQGGGSAPSGPTMRPVAGRTFIPQNGGASSNLQLMAQSSHVLEDAVDGVLEITWPGDWWVAADGQGELLQGAAGSGRASVLYTDADTGAPTIARLYDAVTASDTATQVAGNLVMQTAGVKAKRGARIVLRFWGNFPNGMVFCQGCADYTNGDILKYGATATDLTGTTTAFTDTWQGARHAFMPLRIRAMSERPSVGIVCDSRGYGIQDVPNDTLGHIGSVPRLIGGRMAYTNVSIPGSLASTWADPVKTERRRALVDDVQYLFVGLGINDTIAQGAAAAAVLANVQSVQQSLGKPAIVCTLNPWVTGGNSAIYSATNDPKRQAYNALVRAVPAGFVGIFDPAAVMETAGHLFVDSGYISSDGVHETNLGNAFAAANAGFDWTTVGDPDPYVPPPFDMADLGTTMLRGWYKPGTATIAAWPDSSGNTGRDFAQATAGNQPVLASSGGGLTFATGKQMDAAGIDGGTEALTEGCFAVFTVADTNTAKRLFSCVTGNGREYSVHSNGYLVLNQQGTAQLNAAGPYTVGKHIGMWLSAPLRSGTLVAYEAVNGGAGAGETASWSGTGFITRMGGLGNITIHELVRVDRSISTEQRQKIEGRLAWDHGLQASLPSGHPYKDAAP